MQYLASIVMLGLWLASGVGTVTGMAQGGGSRALQPADPCLVIPIPPECDGPAEDPDVSEPSRVEVDPLPAPEPAPVPEIVAEDTQAPAPALTETEEDQVEESTITPLYDEEGEAELEREVDQTEYTDNNVGTGLAKLITLIYLAFTGLGFVISGAVALVTYFVRRKNGGNTETSFLKVPLVFGCLVVLGGIAYAFLNTL